MLKTNSHGSKIQNKPIWKIITSLSLSHLQSVFLRHRPSVDICNSFPFLLNSKIVSLSRLFLSKSRIFYFSSNNVFRIDFKIVPEAKFFLKMRNAFLLFYQIWKRFLLSAFGGLSHSGKETIRSWWLIWMTRVGKVTDSNKFITDLRIFNSWPEILNVLGFYLGSEFEGILAERWNIYSCIISKKSTVESMTNLAKSKDLNNRLFL